MNGVNSLHEQNNLTKKSSCFNTFEEKIDMEIQLLQSLFNQTDVINIKTSKRQQIIIKGKSFNTNKDTYCYMWLNIESEKFPLEIVIEYKKHYPFIKPIFYYFPLLESEFTIKLKKEIDTFLMERELEDSECVLDACIKIKEMIKFLDTLDNSKIKEFPTKTSKKNNKIMENNKCKLKELNNVKKDTNQKYDEYNELKRFAGIDKNRFLDEEIININNDNFNDQLFSLKFTDKFKSRFKNDFIIHDSIGKGGGGEVFKVVNKFDGNLYAVKKVEFNANKTEEVKSLIKEVLLLSRLYHNNIVRYYQAWVEDKETDDKCNSDDELFSSNSKNNSLHKKVFNYKSTINRLSVNEFNIYDDNDEFSGLKSNNIIKTEDDDLNFQKKRSYSFQENDSSEFKFMQNKHLNSDISNSNIKNEDISKSKELTRKYLKSKTNIKEIISEEVKSKKSNDSIISEKSKKLSKNEKKMVFNIWDDDSDNEDDELENSKKDSKKNIKLNENYDNKSKSDSDSDIVFEKIENKNNNNNACNNSVLKVEKNRLKTRAPKSLKLLFIQMEFCESKTLREAIDENRLDEKSKWEIINQIIEALIYIHNKKLIHRDLKPSNIFLMSNNIVKVGDFGLATSINFLDSQIQNGANNKKLEHVMLNNGNYLSCNIGTLHYASPEQEQSKIYNEKTDMYSLGIIIFEMFFAFKTYMEREKTLKDIFNYNQYPKDISEKIKTVGIVEICKNLTNRDPKMRMSSIELMSSKLIPNNFNHSIILDNFQNIILENSNLIPQFISILFQHGKNNNIKNLTSNNSSKINNDNFGCKNDVNDLLFKESMSKLQSYNFTYKNIIKVLEEFNFSLKVTIPQFLKGIFKYKAYSLINIQKFKNKYVKLIGKNESLDIINKKKTENLKCQEKDDYYQILNSLNDEENLIIRKSIDVNSIFIFFGFIEDSMFSYYSSIYRLSKYITNNEHNFFNFYCVIPKRPDYLFFNPNSLNSNHTLRKKSISDKKDTNDGSNSSENIVFTSVWSTYYNDKIKFKTDIEQELKIFNTIFKIIYSLNSKVKGTFILRLNSSFLLDFALEKHGIDDETTKYKIYILLSQLSAYDKKTTIKRIIEEIESKLKINVSECFTKFSTDLKGVKAIIDQNKFLSDYLDRLEKLICEIEKVKPYNLKIIFDFSLIVSLDFLSGLFFELKHSYNSKILTIAHGGRIDSYLYKLNKDKSDEFECENKNIFFGEKSVYTNTSSNINSNINTNKIISNKQDDIIDKDLNNEKKYISFMKSKDYILNKRYIKGFSSILNIENLSTIENSNYDKSDEFDYNILFLIKSDVPFIKSENLIFTKSTNIPSNLLDSQKCYNKLIEEAKELNNKMDLKYEIIEPENFEEIIYDSKEADYFKSYLQESHTSYEDYLEYLELYKMKIFIVFQICKDKDNDKIELSVFYLLNKNKAKLLTTKYQIPNEIPHLKEILNHVLEKQKDHLLV